MQNPYLQIDYRGIDIRVEVIPKQSVCLYINNINRAQDKLSSDHCTVILNSSVQTDYEWHEFIEARVTLQGDMVSIGVEASNIKIAEQEFNGQDNDSSAAGVAIWPRSQ